MGLFGQLRLVIATMDIEEINADRDKFLAAVSQNVEAELRKIGQIGRASCRERVLIPV